MRIKKPFYLVFLFCVSCLIHDSFNNYPHGNDTGMVLKTSAISSTASELNFETNLIFLLGTSDYLTLGYIEQKDLTFSGNGTYTITSFQNVEVQPVSFSNSMVLIDQSGTFSDLDSKNMRSKGVNKLMHDMSPANFLLGGVSKGGRLITEPLEVNGTFSSDPDSSVPYLFDLPKRVGGQSAIYDGINQAIEKLKLVSGPRNVVLLGHNLDQASTTSINTVIASAQANQVAIHVIYLGLNAQTFARLSQATGGILSICSTEEMITSFNQLNGVLTEKRFVYKVKVKFVPTGGVLVPGSDTYHDLKVHDGIYNVDFNPLKVYVKAP